MPSVVVNNTYTINQSRLFSMECFSHGCEAVRSEGSAIVDYTHRFVTSVSWDAHTVVFNDVLLDNSLTSLLAKTLPNSNFVNICFRKVAVVTWDVRSGLGCSNAIEVL
jgi:hypothetical protein